MIGRNWAGIQFAEVQPRVSSEALGSVYDYVNEILEWISNNERNTNFGELRYVLDAREDGAARAIYRIAERTEQNPSYHIGWDSMSFARPPRWQS